MTDSPKARKCPGNQRITIHSCGFSGVWVLRGPEGCATARPNPCACCKAPCACPPGTPRRYNIYDELKLAPGDYTIGGRHDGHSFTVTKDATVTLAANGANTPLYATGGSLYLLTTHYEVVPHWCGPSDKLWRFNSHNAAGRKAGLVTLLPGLQYDVELHIGGLHESRRLVLPHREKAGRHKVAGIPFFDLEFFATGPTPQ